MKDIYQLYSKNGKIEMKQILILIVLSANVLLSQISHNVIFKSDYKNLPFGIEKDNSRIYSVASFDVSEDFIEFSSLIKPWIFSFSEKSSSISTGSLQISAIRFALSA